jgi:hypothetical protein
LIPLTATGFRSLAISDAVTAAQRRAFIAKDVKSEADNRRPMVLVRGIQIQRDAVLSVEYNAIGRIVVGRGCELAI